LPTMRTLGPAQRHDLTTQGTWLSSGCVLSAARTDSLVGEETQRAMWANDLTAVGAGPKVGLKLGTTFRAVRPGKETVCYLHGGRARGLANCQVERFAAGRTDVGTPQHAGAADRTLAHEEQVAAWADLGVDQQLQATVGAVKEQVVTTGRTSDFIVAGGCAAVRTASLAAGRTEAIHQQHHSVTGGTERATRCRLVRPSKKVRCSATVPHTAAVLHLAKCSAILEPVDPTFVEQCAAMGAECSVMADLSPTLGADQCKLGAARRAKHLVGGQGDAALWAQVLIAGGTVVSAGFQAVVTPEAFHDTLLRFCSTD
jgi:hypothetical protein